MTSIVTVWLRTTPNANGAVPVVQTSLRLLGRGSAQLTLGKKKG